MITNYLRSMGLINKINVTTTSGALGTPSDIIIFSLVRNNEEKDVGNAGMIQDINDSLSKSGEKLLILGNFGISVERSEIKIGMNVS